MVSKILKWYLFQVGFSFFLSFILIFLMGLYGLNTNNIIHEYRSDQFFGIALINSCLMAFLNLIINALNFTYAKWDNRILSFYLPAMIWILPLSLFLIYDLDFYILPIWLQPAIYNVLASHFIKV
jgi:hypothetical protein